MNRVKIKSTKRGRPSKKTKECIRIAEDLLNSEEVQKQLEQIAIQTLIYGNVNVDWDMGAVIPMSLEQTMNKTSTCKHLWKDTYGLRRYVYMCPLCRSYLDHDK